ncbi:glycoside hydrolase family 26 protein [Kitasatospora sp. NPDC004615]|uniref:glycoside hydrolase family 26 protein n=1 Tax=unclassified Kitasatospora TaxID=2633591 RepID=UPI0036D083D1
MNGGLGPGTVGPAARRVPARWVVGVAVVALVAAGGALGFRSGGDSSGLPPRLGGPVTPGAPSSQSPDAPSPSGSQNGTVATMDALRRPNGVLFGVSTPGSPNKPETDTVAVAAGRQPTVQEYYVNWNQDFAADDVSESYDLGAVPLVTWQPSDGRDAGEDQPKYSLRTIAAGAHDAYLTSFADAVKKSGRPVVLRFAHEMNATWYPWYEGRSGNQQGDYVKAWRHIHDLFEARGVTNVIWFWCPNIHRGTEMHSLSRYYPGDGYVDWIGMDAYSESESDAETVLGPTYQDLAELSDKPIFIGEVGVKPNINKALWIVDFFRWLQAHPRVVGFSWFQHSDQEGGRYDWRFTTSPGALKAFQDGLVDQRLVQWPMR